MRLMLVGYLHPLFILMIILILMIIIVFYGPLSNAALAHSRSCVW
jgi:hypothetical protein